MCHGFVLDQCVRGMLVFAMLTAVCRAEEKGPQAAEADVNRRFAEASLRVAEAELSNAIEAARKTPGAIAQAELRRLEGQVELARLQVERAKIQKAASTPAATRLSEAEAAINKVLDEKSNADFVEIPLGDVVEFYREKHKIPIQLDHKPLDDAGIGTDVPITRQIEGVSLRSILNLLLRELELTYLIKDEVLVITTRDQASQQLETVVYDVLDLVTSERDQEVDFASLQEVITATVHPTTWSEIGGPGTFAHLQGMVVISQTQAVHRDIADLLTKLRKTRAARTNQQPAMAGEDAARVSLRVYKVNVPLLPIAVTRPSETPSPANADKGTPKPILNQFGESGMGMGTHGMGMPGMGMSGMGMPGMGMSGMGMPGMARGPIRLTPTGETVILAPDADYLKNLATTIRSTIEPQSWQPAGGQGVIETLPANEQGVGTLVIKHTGSVHAQVERLLKEVETTRPKFDGATSGIGFF
jgi:hypothetical protein